MRIQEALEAISEGALDTTLNVNEFHGQQKRWRRLSTIYARVL